VSPGDAIVDSQFRADRVSMIARTERDDPTDHLVA
jgi:hypothetical protein